MSMKFLSGLQDLLGLYDNSNAANSPQSPSTAIPPSSPLYPSSVNRSARRTVPETSASSANDDKVQRCSHERNVHFSEELVTGYSEAPHSPFVLFEEEDIVNTAGNSHGPDPELILTNYKRVCDKASMHPLGAVVRQIGYMHRIAGVRQETLSLKGERVSHAVMETLEEIFKLVQFDTLDFEYTFLDDDGVISLCEMIEFYNSTHKLNLSFNRQITGRGWAAIFRVMRNCHALQVLNLRYTSVDNSLSALCRTIRTHPIPQLTCLHLENVQLSGKSLLLLVCALKFNTFLKELFLGENNLQPSDGIHLYQLITNNSTLQMLDLRNNELGDQGLNHLCDALKNKDTLDNSALTALVLWNNRISHQSMGNLAAALIENAHLETLNIGSNALGLDGITQLKHALAGKSNLHRLGLQQTNLDCEAAIVLAECLADNTVMIRVDIRENPKIGSAGLLALHSSMKYNKSITNLNLDEGCVVPTSEKVRPYQDEFRRYFDEIRGFCERNKKAALERMAVKTSDGNGPTAEAKASEGPSGSDGETSKSDEDQKPAPIVKKKTGNKFCRSASLTCEETITDIPERIRQMSGSTHSLDEVSHPQSVKTIKKFNVTTLKTEWGSLPAIPAAVSQETSPTTPKAAPVVKKMRRFSVSPTSSTFSISSPSDLAPQMRPHSLSISIPVTTLSVEHSGPMSAPTMYLAQKVNEPVIEEPENISIAVPSSNDVTALEEEVKEEEKKIEQMLHLDAHTPEEEDVERKVEVRAVVTDLVNYVVYEETSQVERKKSLLLGTCFSRPDPQLLLALFAEETPSSTPSTPGTPSRIHDIAEELSEEESIEQVVQSVVRGLVRDVLKAEKTEKAALRQALEHRRKQRTAENIASSSQ